MSDEIVKAIGALREAADNKEQVSVKKFEEIEAKAFAMEAQNQELTAKVSQEEKSRVEMGEKLELIEKQLTRSQAGTEEQHQLKAYQKAIVKGVKSLDEREMKTLRTDINAQGGFLVRSPEIMQEIIKDITEISPIRQLARVRSTNSQSLKFRKRASIATASWKGELETADVGNSTYGLDEITVNKLPITVEISDEELRYAEYNMASEIQQDAAEEMAFQQNFAFINGDGVKKPNGFLLDADVIAGATTSATSGVLAADDFAVLIGQLKAAYNPTLGFNRATWSNAVNLKDSAGQYVINFGNLSAGIPNTIRGIPYVIMQDMPNVAANALAVVAGDFARGYMVVDGYSMEVIRDDFTGATDGLVKFTFKMGVGGGVLKSEAIKVLRIKA